VPKFDEVKKNPAVSRAKILDTTNSTGDYAVQACLKKWGIAKADVQLVNLGQAQIISAITSNNGDLAGVWAPNMYTLEEKGGAKLLCSGFDAGAIIPGAIVARPDYAKANPQTVAKFLAVYLRAWNWVKANPKDARTMMKTFYAQGGVEISDKGIEAEFSQRPVFTLAEQVKIMDRSNGKSDVDTWLGNIGEFMKAVGTLPDVPEAKTYVDDTYMKKVVADPALAAMAAKSN
jgi:NitT/TauT family transport system substrate-binding protein